MISKQSAEQIASRNNHSIRVVNRDTVESATRTRSSGVWLSRTGEETRLEVAAAREIRYSTIHPAANVLNPNNPAIQSAVGDRPVLAVVDQRINALYGAALRTYLEQKTRLSGYIPVNGAEASKTWAPV